MEVGEKIEIKEDHKSHIKTFKETIDTYRTMELNGSAGIRDSNKKLWEFIKETYPETDGYRLSLNNEKDEILILGKE